MRLIVISGMPGSGKDEFIKTASDYGIPSASMGDLVREYHSRRSEEDRDLSVGQFASAERDRYGFDIWAKRILERAHGDVFLIDGCRSMDEVIIFRGMTPDVLIVGIFASPATRYKRLVERGRYDAPNDYDEFIQRDEREIGWGLAKILALADVMIVNESSLEEFRISVRYLMDGLR